MRTIVCLVFFALAAAPSPAQLVVRGRITLPRVRITVGHAGRLRGHGHHGRRVVVRYPRRAPHCERRTHRRGHWVLVRERVYVPPVFEWRTDACGRSYRVLIRPGHYTYVTRRVFVEDR